jgi:hypothetical protein
MSIIAQPRRPGITNLRIAIWSAFLLVLVAPLLFERTGHPYYAALILRPGGWILSRINPGLNGDRGILLLNFVLYTVVIYALIRSLRMKRQERL